MYRCTDGWAELPPCVLQDIVPYQITKTALGNSDSIRKHSTLGNRDSITKQRQDQAIVTASGHSDGIRQQ